LHPVAMAVPSASPPPQFGQSGGSPILILNLASLFSWLNNNIN
jgi:hypothetical protein